MRINSGTDDGDQLAISEGFRAKIGGLTEGTRNAKKATDLFNTVAGTMGEISSILLFMRDLFSGAMSDTRNGSNRTALDLVVQLTQGTHRPHRYACHL